MVDELVVQISDSLAKNSRVLVVSKDLLVAEALVAALAHRGFDSRGIAPSTNGHGLNTAWHPDVALFMIEHGDGPSSIEFIRRLRGLGVRVAVMSDESTSTLITECLEAGASSAIDTRSPLASLVAFLSEFTNGKPSDHVMPTLETKDLSILTSGPQEPADARRLAPFAILTTREKCVLGELMEGHRAEVISRHASVSISTVRSQIRAILQKLGVNSQLAAVAMARQAGWHNHDESRLESDGTGYI